ncbi:DUF4168 domain-containing protein [Kushneria aurantia]|uniref:DUF4168 domain-containing protein n=1 Tax=Kushneria aurantia TaxID=504092 RepID=A0ABV6G278_9GAMM|nr:DUF4168 domain-containing protein [Kushneria aurantia]
MRKVNSLLGAALLSLGVLAAGPAMAASQSQPQQGAPSAQQAPQPVDPGTLSSQYSDDQLHSFLEVNRDMIPVVRDLSRRSSNIENREQAQALMEEFQTSTQQSLQEHGLSVQNYQQIGLDASRDSALEQRLIDMDPELYQRLQALQSQQQPAQ